MLLFKADILFIELSLDNSKRVSASTDVEGCLDSFTYRPKDIEVCLVDLVTGKTVPIPIGISVTVNPILDSLVSTAGSATIIGFSESGKGYSVPWGNKVPVSGETNSADGVFRWP